MNTDKVRQLSEDLRFPGSVDINPTARCNLHCSFCWGPDHTLPDSLTAEDWEKVIRFFAYHGTTAIVFTGGEPLVRKDTGRLLEFAKFLGMRVTLSTNTLLLRKRADQCLPFVDEIGIPLDGSNAVNNSSMRLGNSRAFASALDAMHFVKSHYGHIEITIRTVVSRVNKHDISSIGALLDAQRDFLDRWKLYQFTPVSIGAIHRCEHEIDAQEFNMLTSTLEQRYPHMPIISYSVDQRPGRYVFVGPEGNVFGVAADGTHHEVFGNWKQLLDGELTSILEERVDVRKNTIHAHSLSKQTHAA
jgi:MoaA/NifB/PqqE/SkfB family radical SAM enzyme